MVLAPTYQEAENVERYLDAVRESLPDADVWIIDDSSPDGTGAIAQRCAERLGRIRVIHRTTKEGLGSAYRHGFREALGAGYDAIVSMDVDFSHDPHALADLVGALRPGVDVVVGSRYVPGGSTVSWPLHRRLLSRWGNRYTSFALGLHVRDSTSGYRVYRATSLAAADPDATDAEGYAFLTELLRRLVRTGAVVVEQPITFVDRAYGTSKMSGRIVVESMLRVTTWGLRDLWARLRRH